MYSKRRKVVKIDKEFLQYIKDTGYNDLLNIDKRAVIKCKNTLHYQCWRLGKEINDGLMESIKKAILNIYKRHGKKLN